ncbi:hypothetical protein OC835_005439, partial [Tilletia horrida]
MLPASVLRSDDHDAQHALGAPAYEHATSSAAVGNNTFAAQGLDTPRTIPDLMMSANWAFDSAQQALSSLSSAEQAGAASAHTFGNGIAELTPGWPSLSPSQRFWYSTSGAIYQQHEASQASIEDDPDLSGFEPPSGLLPPVYMPAPPKRSSEASTSQGAPSASENGHSRTTQLQATPESSAMAQVLSNDRRIQRSLSFNSARSVSFTQIPADGGRNHVTSASPYHLGALQGSSVEISTSSQQSNVAVTPLAATGPSSLLSNHLRQRNTSANGKAVTLDGSSPQQWWPPAGLQADIVRQRHPSMGAIHPTQVFSSSENASDAPHPPSGVDAGDAGHQGPSRSMRLELPPSSPPRSENIEDDVRGIEHPDSPSLRPARKRARTLAAAPSNGFNALLSVYKPPERHDVLEVPREGEAERMKTRRELDEEHDSERDASGETDIEFESQQAPPALNGTPEELSIASAPAASSTAPSRRRVIIRWNGKSNGPWRRSEQTQSRNGASRSANAVSAGPSRAHMPISAARSTATSSAAIGGSLLPQLHSDDVEVSSASRHVLGVRNSHHARDTGPAAQIETVREAERKRARFVPDVGPLSDLSVSSSTSHSRSMMEKAAEVLASLKTEVTHSPPALRKDHEGDALEKAKDDEMANDGAVDEAADHDGAAVEAPMADEGVAALDDGDGGAELLHLPLASALPLPPAEADEDDNSSALSSIPSDDEKDGGSKASSSRRVTRVSTRRTSRAQDASPQQTTSMAASSSVSAAGPSATLQSDLLVSAERRTFPAGIPIDESLPLFYQRYFVPSSVPAELWPKLFGGDSVRLFDNEVKREGKRATEAPRRASFQEPASLLNLYTPRFVRGQGMTKEGLCPICWETGEENFFKLKQSSYNYHLQYAHGISAVTGEPFAPPIDIRVVKRPKREVRALEKESIKEGKCHVCKKYVPIENVKVVDIKVPEIV